MTSIRYSIVLSLATLIAPVGFAAPPPAKPASTNAAAAGMTVEAARPERTAAKETPAEHDARMHWWREAKFGLFIHWGVYAVPAGKYGGKDGYGEWIMHSAKIPVAEYRTFARQFNPVKYNPAAVGGTAKDAGMRYIVITSKHHDGFALFPSDVTKWDVADATPYKKDLLGPLVERGQRRAQDRILLLAGAGLEQSRRREVPLLGRRGVGRGAKRRLRRLPEKSRRAAGARDSHSLPD